MFKCHLCYDLLREEKTPACMEACPTGTMIIGKRNFMEAEHGRSLGIMLRIKTELLDPRGIVNPGKKLP
jgi:Fe-S-cluster-containing dehydrogenase component